MEMAGRFFLAALCSFLTPISVCPTAEAEAIFTKLTKKGSASIPVLEKRTVHNTAECALTCSMVSQCLSFSLGSRDRSCALHASQISTQDVSPASSAEEEDSFYNRQPSDCPLARGYTIVPSTDKCVRLDTSLQNWTQARESCQAEGGQLLSIQDLDTWTAVRAYLEGATQDDSSIYVGGYRGSGGLWRWMDGSAVPSNLWYPGNPDGDSTCNCLQLWWRIRASSFLLLDDAVCDKSKAFVCEL